MYTDPELCQRFRQFDEDQRVEDAARELARRIREAERIRRRADELLEQDDDLD